MAATASGLYTLNWADILDGTLTMPFDTGYKMQLLETASAITPDFDTHTSITTYDADDPGSTGDYTAGGNALVNPVAEGSVADGGIANTITLDCDDFALTGTTFSGATSVNALLHFDENEASDSLQCLLYFGDTTTVSGTLTITYPTNGFIQIPHV